MKDIMRRGDDYSFASSAVGTYAECVEKFGWRESGKDSLGFIGSNNTVVDATPEGYKVIFINHKTFPRGLEIDDYSITIKYKNCHPFDEAIYVIFYKMETQSSYRFAGVYRQKEIGHCEKKLSLVSDEYPCEFSDYGVRFYENVDDYISKTNWVYTKKFRDVSSKLANHYANKIVKKENYYKHYSIYKFKKKENNDEIR